MRSLVKIFFLILILSLSAFSQQARLIDKFGLSANCEDAKARLDNFAIELNNQPTAKGYIVYYGGRYYPILKTNKKLKNSLPRTNEAKTRTQLFESYLISNRGISTAKFDLIDGGFREEYEVELWILPASAKLPNLKPTVKNKDIKVRKGKISKKELAAMFNC